MISFLLLNLYAKTSNFNIYINNILPYVFMLISRRYVKCKKSGLFSSFNRLYVHCVDRKSTMFNIPNKNINRLHTCGFSQFLVANWELCQ